MQDVLEAGVDGDETDGQVVRGLPDSYDFKVLEKLRWRTLGLGEASSFG